MKKLLNVFLFLSIASQCLYGQFGSQVEYILPDPSGTTPGEVCFVDTNNYPGTLDTVCLKSPADVTTPYDLTFPAALPGAQSCMEVSTGGVISFTGSACGTAGGSPGGSDRDIQFNDAGAFGGDDTFQLLIDAGNDNPTLRLGQTSGSSTATLFDWRRNSTSVGARLRATGGGVTTFDATLDFFAAETKINSTLQVLGNVTFDADGTRDIGTAAASVGNTFTHLLNTKTLQIENAGETARHTIDLDASNHAVWDNTSGGQILEVRNTGAVEFFGSLLANLDSTYDIGENATRLRNAHLDLVNAETIQVTNSTHGTNWIIEQGADTTILQVNDSTQDVLEIDVELASTDFTFGNTGVIARLLPHANKTGVVGASGQLWSSVNADSIVAGDTGEAGSVTIFDGSGGSGRWSSTNGDLIAVADVVPSSDNLRDLGLEGTIWSDAWSNTFHAGNPGVTGTRRQGTISLANADATATTVASFVGTVANSGTASEHAVIQVDNFDISNSGNFYGRTFSGGDASCTNIDDGWMGIRTDTEEIQICIGGNTRVVALGVP